MASIFITGASTGFGRDAAERFARRGHHVFATMRDIRGRNAAPREELEQLATRDKLGLDPAKLNPNGGSISIGHPFGMTGSRLVGTIGNELQRRKKKYGVVTMCVGGGQGGAALFESCL